VIWNCRIQEQGARSREQGAGSKEQEQGAGGKEQEDSLSYEVPSNKNKNSWKIFIIGN